MSTIVACIRRSGKNKKGVGGMPAKPVNPPLGRRAPLACQIAMSHHTYFAVTLRMNVIHPGMNEIHPSAGPFQSISSMLPTP